MEINEKYKKFDFFESTNEEINQYLVDFSLDLKDMIVRNELDKVKDLLESVKENRYLAEAKYESIEDVDENVKRRLYYIGVFSGLLFISEQVRIWAPEKQKEVETEDEDDDEDDWDEDDTLFPKINLNEVARKHLQAIKDIVNKIVMPEMV